MKFRKRIMGCTAVFAAVAMAVPAGQAREGGSPAGARRGGRMGSERMAEVAKAAAPLTATAVAQYLKLSKEEAKKFSAAYITYAEASQKKLTEAFRSGDRKKMTATFNENRENMRKMLEKNLKPEQAKKAEVLLGFRFGGLSTSIEVLLGANAEPKKIEKALPTLVEHTLNQQKLIQKMRDGAASPQDVMPKLRELNEATAKQLSKILGEKAASFWREGYRVFGRRTGGAGGEGREGARRGAGESEGR